MNINITGQKQKILIVDDSEMNRAILADMLEEYEIIEAENGEEAVALLREQVNDIVLVLLDIVMPKMDGFGVLQVMQENNWIEQVPVIMISAESDSVQVEKAYEMGVTDFIARPFDAIIVQKRAVNTILLYAKQKGLIRMVDRQIRETERQQNMMIDILSHVVEFRNGESGLHVLHVRILTEMLLRQMQKVAGEEAISDADISAAGMASALHDIGKIAIDSKILNKPGKLTDEEFALMKEHTVIGAKMLDNLPRFQDEPLVRTSYEICRWHHERYDGRGYPDGLKGDDIPIVAQVVSIADVYDALTSERVYKKAFSHETAIKMILEGQCGVFNPVLLDCLMQIEGNLEENLKGAMDEKRKEKTYNPEPAQERNLYEERFTANRSLRLLDMERKRHETFAVLTGEIQFEYSVQTDSLILSTWGAKRLGLREVIEDPVHDAEVNWLLGEGVWEKWGESIRKTSSSSPLLDFEVQLPVDGERRWHKISVMALWSGEDSPQYRGVIGKAVDIQESISHMKDLEKRAYHDTLTGLLNHATAKAVVKRRMEKSSENGWALAILDLDRFKSANDSYGHLFGDKVLKFIAEKLRQNTDREDIVARVGGDEFLIFTECKPGFEEKMKKTFEALTGVYEDFPVCVSMGIARTADAGNDYKKLFHMADQALYSAKRAGRRRYLFYDPSMHGTFSVISPIERSNDEKVNL